jgi:hypothetical protein
MSARATFAVVALLSVSCGDGSNIAPPPAGADAGAPDARPDAVVPPRDPPSCDEALGAPIIRRLTSTQIDNTLEDLFSSPDVPRASVFADPAVRGYDVDANAAVVRDLDADQWMRHAETVAEWAVRERLDRITSCTDTGAVCQLAFIRGLGLSLYRRPLDDDTMTAYLEMLIDEPDFESGATAMLAAMLQSPHFLYRMEIGEPVPDASGTIALGPFELASALSFFVTNAAPDAELLEAAGNGRLETPDDLDRELDRLLSTPRARGTHGHFVRQWLLVDDLERKVKDPSVAEYTDEARASMLRETETFYVTVFESGGGIAELFDARYAFANGPLAELYGIVGIDGEALRRFEVAEGRRAPGVLGQGSVLTEHALADSSSPVQRGALVRRRFLCETLPPPPPGVNTTLPPRGETETTRDRARAHSEDPFCARCHRRMDPVGFALEHYDAFGRRRAEENGQPIDATGQIVGTPDGDIPLEGAESLSRYLSESPEARACFVENLAYYAFGVEGCTWASVVDGLAFDTPLREILRRIVHAPNFRFRRAEGE